MSLEGLIKQCLPLLMGMGFYMLSSNVEAISSHATPSQAESPLSIGNFTLPASQQPGPFFSFGQNIIDKGDLQYYVYPNYTRDSDARYTEIDSYLLYGITDVSSLLLTVPLAADYVSGRHQSSGFGDVGGQLEYAFYEHSTSRYSQQATVVGGLSLPTGSLNKSPSTGYGAPSYFVGGTYNQTFVEWLWFTSPGILWISPADHISRGPQYFYQFGLGHLLDSIKSKYIFLGLLELDGQYSEKNKIFGVVDPNSGGNIIYATPSLWFSTSKLILQLGLSLPIMQQWNGTQSKSEYYLSFTLGWTMT